MSVDNSYVQNLCSVSCILDIKAFKKERSSVAVS